MTATPIISLFFVKAIIGDRCGEITLHAVDEASAIAEGKRQLPKRLRFKNGVFHAEKIG